MARHCSTQYVAQAELIITGPRQRSFPLLILLVLVNIYILFKDPCHDHEHLLRIVRQAMAAEWAG